MITVKIGGNERTFERVSEVDENWINQQISGLRRDRLAKSEFATEDMVEISCRTSQNVGSGSNSAYAMLASFGNMSAAEVATIWARRTLLGESSSASERNRFDMTASFSKPDTATLPEILKTYNARGWLAEGLVRLFAVEEVSRRYDGHFQYLDVGPSTATDVRLHGAFTFGTGYGTSEEPVAIDGIVALQ